MTVQFLYPWLDDEADGAELRRSLRGLDRFFHRPFEVTIVGDMLPSWITGVHHVPVERENLPGSVAKQMNILLNYLDGCRAIVERDPSASEVICMDDDYMLLEPVRSILPHYAGTFQSRWVNRNRYWEPGFDWWLTSLGRTFDLLNTAGCRNPRWYDLHRPFPIEPNAAIRLLQNFEGKPPVTAPLWRTLYGNLVGYENREVWMRDVRVSGSKWPGGTSWLSTDQRHWGRTGPRIDRWLPAGSRFER